MTTTYDESLFHSLLELDGFFNETTWLRGCSTVSLAEKNQFISNEVENPKFNCCTTTGLSDLPSKSEEIAKKIKNSTAPAVVIDLYERKLTEQMLRQEMAERVTVGDDEGFFKVSTALYGKPRKKYFAYISRRLLKLCDDLPDNNSEALKRIKRVASKISAEETGWEVGVLPTPEMNGRKIEDVSEVQKIFKETLKRCKVSGWQIVTDKTGERTRFGVDANEQIIYLPSEKQLLSRPMPFTETQVKAMAECEIGVHARRAYEGRWSSLRLLGVGLDKYLVGEEGLAGYVQQQINGASEFFGFDRYLAASLAVGLDGERRDFRSVFLLMADYYTLRLLADGKKVTKTAPYRLAWEVCVRIFRGTTGQTAGCIYTKDIVYLEGNIGVWNLLTERPQVFESLFVGKFNPLLSRHIRTLQTLEILKEW